MTTAEIGVLSLRVLFGSVGVAIACLVVLAAWVVGCGACALYRGLVGPLVRSQSPAVELRAGLWRAVCLFWITVRGEVL